MDKTKTGILLRFWISLFILTTFLSAETANREFNLLINEDGMKFGLVLAGGEELTDFMTGYRSRFPDLVLEKIILYDISFDHRFMNHIESLLRWQGKHLKTLHVINRMANEVGLSSANLRQLVQLMNPHGLKSFRWEHQQEIDFTFRNETFKANADFWENLEELSFAGTPITNGEEMLLEFQFDYLNILNLGSCKLDKKLFLKMMTNAERMPKLRQLYYDGNKIRPQKWKDSERESVRQSAVLSNLSYLGIADSRTDKEGYRAMLDISTQPPSNMQYLSTSYARSRLIYQLNQTPHNIEFDPSQIITSYPLNSRFFSGGFFMPGELSSDSVEIATDEFLSNIAGLIITTKDEFDWFLERLETDSTNMVTLVGPAIDVTSLEGLLAKGQTSLRHVFSVHNTIQQDELYEIREKLAEINVRFHKVSTSGNSNSGKEKELKNFWKIPIGRK